MRKAFEAGCENVHVKSHRSIETTLYLALDEHTLVLYVKCINRFIGFVHTVFVQERWTGLKKKIMSSETEEAMKGLIRIWPAAEQDTFETSAPNSWGDMHELFKLCLFENKCPERDVVTLFVSCLAVVGNSEEKGSPKALRHGTAWEQSGIFAALKYLAKCVVVMEIYVKDCQSIVNGWIWTDSASSRNADTGLTYVRFCLWVCNRIRFNETHRIRLIVCREHKQCGFIG